MQKITHGRDFNYFEKVNVVVGQFPDNSQVTFNIKGLVSFSIVNEGSAVVEYSFNGNTLHGDLTPGSNTEALFFDNRRVSAIWFRTQTPGQVVRVEGWSHF